MASGLKNNRDFVMAGVSTETDWHGKTTSKGAILCADDFPFIRGEQIHAAGKPVEGWQIPIAEDDGLPCGKPFGESFTLYTPRQAFAYVESLLAGTRYSAERIGMLWNRSSWFISIKLEELAEIAPKGEKFQFNFSGGLDGSLSPQCELSHTRICCWNTQNISRIFGQVLFKKKLTKNFTAALESATPEIEKAVGMARVFSAAKASVENTACDVQTARELYAGQIGRGSEEKLSTGAENKVNGLVGLFQRGIGNSGRTLGDVLNGFTEYGTRGFSGSKKDVFTRIESSEFGGLADDKAEFARALFDGAEREKMREHGKTLLAMAN